MNRGFYVLKLIESIQKGSPDIRLYIFCSSQYCYTVSEPSESLHKNKRIVIDENYSLKIITISLI